jgi:chromate transporter
MRPRPNEVPFADALRVWARVALQSFGGPAGQIAVMHRIVVEEKRWIGEGRFLHALNFCMLLPGPEAQQLATYLGWLMHGTRGGLAAGVLFVLPGCAAILALSHLYVAFGNVGAVAGLLFGLKAAVLAVVVQALVRLGRRVLGSATKLALAAGAFVALCFFDAPFPLVVAAAAAIGWVAGLAGGAAHAGGSATEEQEREPAEEAGDLARDPRGAAPSLARAVRVLGVALVLWLAPVVLLAAWLGTDSVFVSEAVFFGKAAVVTFGGAYAVLAYVAQQAVERYGWLEPGEMLDGLGMAETTPGPLIMVVQFVGFLGAYRDPGPLPPAVAGTIGALLTTWVTFVPCFLWIFLGAPYVERLRRNRALAAALGGVTAAVVGVIANLAVWFALHVLFGEVAQVAGPMGTRLLVPEPSSIDLAAAFIAAAAFVALVRFGVGMLAVLAASMLAGMAARM